MNIIYFTMKKLNENRAFLAMLGFLFVFSCSKDKKEGNGNGNGDVTKYTLSITPPICGTITDGDAINCGSKGNVCKAQVANGDEVKLIAEADEHYTLGAWGDACASTDAGGACKLTMDANKTVSKAFTASTSDSDNDCIPNDIDTDDDNDTVPDATDVDDDNDGLIEVHNLDMFDHIQYNLAGTSYKTGASIADNRTGGPTAATADCTTVATGVYLCGYELTKDLDFAEGASYAGSSVNAAWRPNAQADAGGSAASPDAALNPGFVGATDFAGLFEGNGYKISNLYSRSTASSAVSIGLFARTTATATIRNVGIVNAHIYGNTTGADFIGSLAGSNSGLILTSYATGGTVNGGSSGGVSSQDILGGLVGQNNGGTIIASYATGAVSGFAPSFDYVGGLVGINGNVGGGGGSIIACYAMGVANGGAGNGDEVGGLVGWNTGSITASYATGAVNGGVGFDDVGSLVGNYVFGGRRSTITASYAFGSKSGGARSDHHDGTAKPDGVTSANGLTATNVDAKWNDAAEKTLNAWDFGTASQAPALRYADYDGDGGVDYCDMFPKAIPGTNIPLICGKSLLPGQGR